jgi:hypothetical protein
MTTVSYTSEVNILAKTVKVEWAGLSAGDEGQPFDCTGLRLASIQATGDFGSGGNVYLHASDEITPTNFGRWQKIEHVSIGDVDFTMFGAIKPVADANIANAGVALLFAR